MKLLFISNASNHHYVLVKDLSTLIGHQINDHNGKKYFCEHCLCPFQSKHVLDKHMKVCKDFEAVKENYPTGDDAILKFKKYQYQLPAPFFVVADFETLQVPIAHCKPSSETRHEIFVSTRLTQMGVSKYL